MFKSVEYFIVLSFEHYHYNRQRSDTYQHDNTGELVYLTWDTITEIIPHFVSARDALIVS